MASIIVKMRKQVALYWEKTGEDEFGVPTFANAVEVSCRWDGEQVLFTDVQGKERVSRATVYPDRDIVHDSFMLEGVLGDLPAADTGPHDMPNSEPALRVRYFGTIPNIKNTERLRVCRG